MVKESDSMLYSVESLHFAHRNDSSIYIFKVEFCRRFMALNWLGGFFRHHQEFWSMVEIEILFFGDHYFEHHFGFYFLLRCFELIRLGSDTPFIEMVLENFPIPWPNVVANLRNARQFLISYNCHHSAVSGQSLTSQSQPMEPNNNGA